MSGLFWLTVLCGFGAISAIGWVAWRRIDAQRRAEEARAAAFLSRMVLDAQKKKPAKVQNSG